MIGTSNYTVYACDRYQVCEMFGIRPNQCGSEEGALQSCCCDSDNCNTPGGFTPPTVDPNPPIQAERCFTGFQTSNLGPLGRSMECLGDCVTYSAGGLKIFGCDPISVCEQLGAKNGTGKFGALNVTCCSTRDCNYQAVTTTTSCYNGITINMPSHNVTYSKAQSLPCKGRCATFSVAYQHLNVDVYTCDPYNVCNLNSSDILKVNCCDSPNCNLNNNTIPVTTVAPMGRNISCFQGFQIGFGFPFGNQMTCDGACARVHIGRDTIYTCDPGDTCGDFGVDGCNMLFDGLTV
uniref:ET module n=1 Tax=Panagrolaimus sp. PS1159 TaxID=55785 RepID=A0AC35GHZ1_9BILA